MKIRLVLLLLFVSVLAACASSPEGMMAMSEPAQSRMMKADAGGQTMGMERFIIRTASVGIEVAEPTETSDKIRALVESYGGQVENTYNDDKTKIHLSVKIPEAKLEAFVEEVATMGDLLNKSFSSYDVTEEMVDIDARLKNLYALRDRFRELLSRADKVADLLAIESELARVQSDIDSIENRRKSLQNQVSFSRANISIEQKTIYGPLGYVANGVYWVVKKLFVIR